MGDEARGFDRKDEVVGRGIVPAPEKSGALQGVEGPIDLDRREAAPSIGKLVFLAEALRVEFSAPWSIAPTADSDPDPSDAGRHGEGYAFARDGMGPASTISLSLSNSSRPGPASAGSVLAK